MGWSELAVCADGRVGMHVGTPLVTSLVQLFSSFQFSFDKQLLLLDPLEWPESAHALSWAVWSIGL